MDPLAAISSSVSPPKLEHSNVRSAQSFDNSSADFKDVLGKAGATDNDAEKSNLREAAVIEEYTAIVTSQYLNPLMKEMSFAMEENGYAMQHYHSMFVDILSKELTQNDSLGLKSIIESKIIK